jgi:glycosyltransferase involved in cell wall biosynthesis
MKLLFIANTSYNLYNFRLPLLKALSEKEYKIIVAAPEDEYTPLLKELFEFYPIKFLDRKGINPIKDLLFLKELIELISKIKPSIIVNITIKPNIWGNIAAAILQIPSIGVITGLGYTFTEKRFPIYQIVKTLYKIALKHPKKVIFQNPDDANFFIKNGIVNPKKVEIILGSGVDLNFFKPFKKIRNNPTIVFGYTGRFLKDKGLFELIKAIKILKEKSYNFKVYLLGKTDKGNPNSIPEEIILKWHKEGLIVYKGFSKNVKPFLEEIDCFIYPSYREGIPRAILEAMAMEKPIITTNSPGCKETVIDRWNGFLIPPKNSKALAEAMEKFLNLSPQQRERFSQNSRKLAAKKFAIDKVINKYIEVIEGVLKEAC